MVVFYVLSREAAMTFRTFAALSNKRDAIAVLAREAVIELDCNECVAADIETLVEYLWSHLHVKITNRFHDKLPWEDWRGLEAIGLQLLASIFPDDIHSTYEQLRDIAPQELADRVGMFFSGGAVRLNKCGIEAAVRCIDACLAIARLHTGTYVIAIEGL